MGRTRVEWPRIVARGRRRATPSPRCGERGGGGAAARPSTVTRRRPALSARIIGAVHRSPPPRRAGPGPARTRRHGFGRGLPRGAPASHEFGRFCPKKVLRSASFRYSTVLRTSGRAIGWRRATTAARRRAPPAGFVEGRRRRRRGAAAAGLGAVCGSCRHNPVRGRRESASSFDGRATSLHPAGMITKDALGPFQAGDGGLPPYLAGRESEQEICGAFLSRLRNGRPPPREIVLHGPRGNGKTALLAWLQKEVTASHAVDTIRLVPAAIRTETKLVERLLPSSWWQRLARSAPRARRRAAAGGRGRRQSHL